MCKAKRQKLTIRKFDGDDSYSYAIFHAGDMAGKGNVIFYGQASPLMSGLDRHSAEYYKTQLEKAQ